MPTLTTPPLMSGPTGVPANGWIAFRPTFEFVHDGKVISANTVQWGRIVNGQFRGESGSGPLTIPPTPPGIGLEIVRVILETEPPQITGVTREREYRYVQVVAVPDAATITWGQLIPVVPESESYVTPDWAIGAIAARDEAVAAAGTASADATRAENAADAAAAVGATHDAVIASRLADHTSLSYAAASAEFVTAVVSEHGTTLYQNGIEL